MHTTYIIAEAGVNHNGDIAIAKQLIDKAKAVGADCIKFQTYKTKNLIVPNAAKANYQLKTTDPKQTQFEMLKNLELDYSDFQTLFEYCNAIGIDFISTPYNFEDVDFLDDLGVNCFKIASGQLTELPFLKYVARKKKKIILSTGMANLAQIFEAVEVIRTITSSEITVLQCTTNYPSNIEEANLNCLQTIKKSCDVNIGYSDHVMGNYACFGAVALGARVIEKHFTLDRSMDGPDHLCSADLNDFQELVEGIRAIEKSLGVSYKKPSPSELKNTREMKRSLVAKTNILKGEAFTFKNLTFKRPSKGLDVNYYDQIIGKFATKDIDENEFVTFNSVRW